MIVSASRAGKPLDITGDSPSLIGSAAMMRIVAWNCNMALERKVETLLDLRPHIAVISECAQPEILRSRSRADWLQADPVWIGRKPHKGLAVLAFNGYAARLSAAYDPRFRYIAS